MRTTIISFIFILCSIFGYGNSFEHYKASTTIIEHIKKHESCKLTAYWDSNGYSIGWGHHSKNVKKGQKITQAKADALLREDIKSAEAAAKRLIKALPYKYNFSQAFFDGLVDCIYNCGEGGVKNSDFYNRLKRCRVKNGKMNESDYTYTIAAVKHLRAPSKGHKTRRYEVHKMMLA